jgi:hypothetical protein
LPVVVAALALQSAASCALAPAIASITLALTHQDGLVERLGYNVRFAAIDAGVAAALMGARLLLLTVGMLLFQLCSAAILPLAANSVTRSQGHLANLYVTAAMIVPQALGSGAGRKPGDAVQWRSSVSPQFPFAPRCSRLSSAVALVCFQTLDGISASVIGVMLPLAFADITRRTGRFNLGMGILGLAGGLGATLSNAVGSLWPKRCVCDARSRWACPVCAGAWREMPDTRPKISPVNAAGTRPLGPAASPTAGH